MRYIDKNGREAKPGDVVLVYGSEYVATFDEEQNCLTFPRKDNADTGESRCLGVWTGEHEEILSKKVDQ